jgi:hypothetical protein
LEIRRYRGLARTQLAATNFSLALPGNLLNFDAGEWCEDHVHPPFPLPLPADPLGRLLVYAWSSPTLAYTVLAALVPGQSRDTGRAGYEVLVFNRATKTVVQGIFFYFPDPDLADLRETRRKALATAYRVSGELRREEQARRREERARQRRRATRGATPAQDRWLRKQLKTLKPTSGRVPGDPTTNP